MRKSKRKSMSMSEFHELVGHVQNKHEFAMRGGKSIKYVRCSYDTRLRDVWSVSLDDKHFSLTNENKDKDLKSWVYDYLEGKDEKAREN